MGTDQSKATDSSAARMRAQQRQLEKQQAEPQEAHYVGDYCELCGYAMVKKLSRSFCSHCFGVAQ